MNKIRFGLGVTTGVAIATTILTAAVYFISGWTIHGGYLIVLAMIGMLACWHILDFRFKTLPATIAAAGFLASVAVLIEIAIIIPSTAYDPGEHFAVLRFVFFDIHYDRTAIRAINDAFYTGSVLLYAPFFGVFMASFLSSGIAVTRSRISIRKKVRIASSIGFVLLIATALVLRYQLGSLIYPYDLWMLLVIPWLILCVDNFVQKAALEWSGKEIPVNVRWQSVGLLALLVSFYVISLPGSAYFVQSMPVVWISLLILPFAIAILAYVMMSASVRRGRIGRMVAVEATAAFIIATELLFVTMIMAIGIQ